MKPRPRCPLGGLRQCWIWSWGLYSILHSIGGRVVCNPLDDL